MPAGHYRAIRDDLIAAGLALDTPCLVVANASRPNQELLWTDVAALDRSAVPQSPALIIIGSVARSRNEALACNTIHAVDPASRRSDRYSIRRNACHKQSTKTETSKFQLTTDGWAVLTALALAALVRIGLIHHVPW